MVREISAFVLVLAIVINVTSKRACRITNPGVIEAGLLGTDSSVRLEDGCVCKGVGQEYSGSWTIRTLLLVKCRVILGLLAYISLCFGRKTGVSVIVGLDW